MSIILKNYELWTSSVFDKKTISNVIDLKEKNPVDFEDSFYKELEFGTGGMRGIMGEGPNRVNKYTFGKTTQGICNFLKKESNEKNISVVIGYDCRNNGKELQQTVSNIFSSNGIKIYTFDSIQPTPLISFAVRELNCNCGIVLTASHNPPEYNGYKVYWKDGGQIVPPIDKKLISEINKIKYSEIQFEKEESLIEILDKGVEKNYLKKSLLYNNSIISNSNPKKLNIVFTSLHGTSYKLLPKLLKKSGFSNIKYVKEQMIPDGNFSNVNSSNPEDESSLKEAIEIAKNNNSDLVLGTDPDADRFGIAVKNYNGKFVHINGNQTMVVLTDYLLSKLSKEKAKSFIASTVVSTPMMSKIAKKNSIKIMLSLTGFKWIGKMINDYPELEYICGGEESFGFLAGNHVRDKDAITSALILSELCNELKNKNSSFYDRLIECYINYGFFKEKLITEIAKGKKGAKEIDDKINSFRKNPPKLLDNSSVVKIYDYKKSLLTKTKNNNLSQIKLPKSNLLIFESSDGTRVAVRPSGTEPKIKYYFSVNTKLNSKVDFTFKNDFLNKKINSLIKQFI
ncbi:MAG: phospho-sugar mutase [Cryomorphaceae bacterium]|nr:MAG: phospho-sugar mutase [Cryomorphaceae bacterium]